MYDNTYDHVHDNGIELVALSFWPPVMARRLGNVLRQAATVAITAGSLVGIAMGFAGASDRDDTLLQAALHSVAVATGLIG